MASGIPAEQPAGELNGLFSSDMAATQNFFAHPLG